MIHSAVTISLVPEASGGPFMFWGDLPGHCAKAARFGFDAIEVFASSGEDVSTSQLRDLLRQHDLTLAAMGTGAGWVVHKLRLTDPDGAVRRRAGDFVSRIIDCAASFGAPAIIGSMQGRAEGGTTRAQALDWLREALEWLGRRASDLGVPLLFEPLNRYETNLINTVSEGLELLRSLETENVKLLCDLYHMNIEERDIADSLRQAGALVGHVHLADSNRRAMGWGHTAIPPIASALHEIGFAGHLSAEILPLPDPDAAAKQTISTFQRFFAGKANRC
jgi:sugar phosphate isomerase/epimerase